MRLLSLFLAAGVSLWLTGCAGNAPQPQVGSNLPQLQSTPMHWELDPAADQQEAAGLTAPSDATIASFELPPLEAVLRKGMALIGTPYRYGGVSESTGFDCSGFINYLFREEAGVSLPRSSRDLASMSAPQVERSKLRRGDLLFFAQRGRVSHAGIYLGDDLFLHSSSTRGGGVRVDTLSSSYWNARYQSARRVPLQN